LDHDSKLGFESESGSEAEDEIG